AGQTSLLVRATSPAPAKEPPPSAPATAQAPAAPAPPAAGGGWQDRLSQVLSQAQPLFALLDAARDARGLEVLRESGAEYQSLYEGPDGELLADFAPYLVRLQPDDGGAAPPPFLARLAEVGWGKCWGVYVTSRQPFKEVRKHFRRFLLVRTP